MKYHNILLTAALTISICSILFCLVLYDRSNEFVTNPEVHEIVDSVLIEIYD